MKKNILSAFVIVAIPSLLLNAQTFQWASTVPNPPYYGSDVTTDSQGNILVAGRSFIAKFDSVQNLIWVRNIGESDGNYISTDKLGNCYVGGGCGNATIYGGNDSVIVTQQGIGDAFIAKYAPDGTILWAQLFGYAYSKDYVKTIKTDADGNSYIAGQSFCWPQTPCQGNMQHFVSKYDTQGSLLWTDTSWANCAPEGLDIDETGNCYMTGKFQGTVNFGSFNLTSTSGSIFIVKYDSSGNVIWAKKDGTNYDEAHGISLDKKGNFYLTGMHSSPSTFGSTTLTGGIGGMFIAKYDTLGTNLWAKHSGAQTGTAVSCDTSGSCFVTGGWKGTQTFGEGSSAVTITSTKPNGEIFVSKYDKDGNFEWVVQPGGSSVVDEANGAYAIHSDWKNNCYITGLFSGTTIFGNTSLYAPSINSPAAFFIAKLKDNVELTTNSSLLQIENNSSLTIFPNPTSGVLQINYSSTEKNKLILNVSNSKGQIIYTDTVPQFQGNYKKNIDLGKHAKGIYFIEIIADKKRAMRKIVFD